LGEDGEAAVNKRITIHRATTGLAVLCLAGGSGASGATLQVTDPEYQMTAFTLSVPADWKSAAQVTHNTGCHGTGAGLETTMRSPDGSTTVAFLPGVRWSWSSSPLERESLAQVHCPAIDIDSAASFLLNIAVPNLRPGATVTAVLPLEAPGQASLQAQMERARQSSEAAAARYHLPPPKVTIDGARVRIRFQDKGKPMEEQIQAVIDCNETTMPGMYKMPASTRRGCSARNVYIVRTPSGHLEDFLKSPGLQKLAQGVQMDPQWLQRVTQDQQAQAQRLLDKSHADFQEMLRQGAANHEAMMERGRQFQQQEQTQFAHAQSLDRANQNATDQAAHRQELDSLGRQDFRNPATGQIIQANAYYDHQWLSSDGSTLIQTDNPNLDPNGAVYPVSQSWTELEPR
jgi:hypothetical protein